MTRRFLNKLNDSALARHHAPWRASLACLAALAVGAGGCGGGGAGGRPGTGAAAPGDSAARHTADSAAAMAAAHDTATEHRLSPSADSIAPYLVFAPTGERQFVAAVRNSQWLLDVGRMDLDVRKDSTKARAFREAAPVLSPVAPRTVFRLWWAKGAEDVVVDSFSVYNGRIVLRVIGSAMLDSAAHAKGSPTAFAVRADSATPPAATTCELRTEPDSAAQAALAALPPVERRAQLAVQKSADSAYAARVAFVRDSLDAEMRASPPPYERLQRRMKTTSSQVRGCFGAARRALVVSVRAGDAEWVRERLVLIAPDGAVTPLRVDDLRFRAHELLSALDADGDGVDDLAVKGTTHRAGGTAILRLDLAKKRAERLAAGFVWETL
ncbi:MAG: hypothetical protein HY944_08310 [Gemmatimonadetes bacterium]|nr:hypothetical protein [Gemmatimonadota bacterium]